MQENSDLDLIIVGASGYIGKKIFTEAIGRNIHVIGTKYMSNETNLLKFDICKDEIFPLISEMKATQKYAILCSANSKIDECYSDYENTYDTNVISTIKLINDLSKNDFSIIFLSTDMVFDGEKGNYSENDKTNAINQYGKMKIIIEEYLIDNVPNSCIMRIGKVVGEMPHKKNLLTEWETLIKENKPIIGIKGNEFTPVALDDIVNLIFLLIEKDLSGVYQICSSEVFDRKRLATMFCLAMKSYARISEKNLDQFSLKDKRPLKTTMQNKKIINATGYRFKTMNQIINGYVDKLKEEK